MYPLLSVNNFSYQIYLSDTRLKITPNEIGVELPYTKQSTDPDCLSLQSNHLLKRLKEDDS